MSVGTRSAEDRPELLCETRPDGTMLVRQVADLDPWPRCMNDRLAHWASVAPDRTWMAERGPDGAWRRMSYAEALAAVRSVGSALLAAGLTPARPLLILSGNSIAHAVMALAAQHVGIPSTALSPAYSLSDGDRSKLALVRDQITPGMVFAEDAAPFLPAIEQVFAPEVILATTRLASAARPIIEFADLAATPPSAEMEAAHRATGHDTVAKFLLTSGTTGDPKAVIQTQGMLCSNQAMVLAAYPFMAEEPPVLVDWAPWNHTASGNKVFNMSLYNGGSYYIDDGRPTVAQIGRTIRNLRDIAPSWYFNVPLGFQFLLDEMERNDALARQFFSRLRMLMYAGAGMSRSVWDRLNAMADRWVPGGLPIVSGLGATETGPFALYYTDRKDAPGSIGIPARGVTLKLVPQGDKLEARLKSPSVTPGYWRNPDLSAAAFDEEGFYRLGDALRFAVPGDVTQGFVFDGRLAENFKLASGTRVAVGALRAALVNALDGLAQDTVIAGEDRDDLRALLVPNWARLREIAGLPEAPPEEVLASPSVRLALQDRLSAHAAQATGSASRVVAALFLAEPLGIDRGEITEKGSVNQRAVLRHRSGLVGALFAGDPAVVHAVWKEPV